MSNFDDEFWSEAPETTGEAEIKGGQNFEPLPDGTKLKAFIEAAEWKFYDPENENVPYIDITWSIEQPEGYQNRKIFHQVKMYGDDPSSDHCKADKQDAKMETARAMFWAIDKNAGGKLATLKRKPENEDLQRYLIGKSMLVTVGLWEINDKSGNWVRKIEPLGGEIPAAKSQAKQAAKPAPKVDDLDEDLIPF